MTLRVAALLCHASPPLCRTAARRIRFRAIETQLEIAEALIREDFDRVFQQVDALVTPTSPVAAFPLGDKTDDPVQMYLIDVCTLPINIAGLPSISLPCGFSQGLPVGMQLIGPHLSEQTLLRIAHAYEQATEWHEARAVL